MRAMMCHSAAWIDVLQAGVQVRRFTNIDWPRHGYARRLVSRIRDIVRRGLRLLQANGDDGQSGSPYRVRCRQRTFDLPVLERPWLATSLSRWSICRALNLVTARPCA